MGLFSKKKQGAMEMPPPPPVEMPSEEAKVELPELPPLPEEPIESMEEELPELPPELPPLPESRSAFKIKAPSEKQIIPHKKSIQPLFISVDDYQFILDGINVIKKKLNESIKDLEKLEQIKKDEEAVLKEWKNKIEDIENKLNYVDKAVVKAD